MYLRLLPIVALVAILFEARGNTFGDANFTSPNYSGSFTTHFSTCGQQLSGKADLVIQHDTTCAINVSVVTPGDEKLSHGTYRLTTEYRLTGDLVDPDGVWFSSDDFLKHTYHISAANPNNLTLNVQGTTPTTEAPPAGPYTATIILTLSWQ